MGWFGRAAPPPATEAGKGRQRQSIHVARKSRCRFESNRSHCSSAKESRELWRLRRADEAASHVACRVHRIGRAIGCAWSPRSTHRLRRPSLHYGGVPGPPRRPHPRLPPHMPHAHTHPPPPPPPAPPPPPPRPPRPLTPTSPPSP